MREVVSKEWFYVGHRGWAFTMECPETCFRTQLKAVIGPEIRVNGTVKSVMGVESFGIPIIHKGLSLGILVNGERVDV